MEPDYFMENVSIAIIKKGLILLVLYAISFSVYYLGFSTSYTPSEEFSSVRSIILMLLIPIFLKYAIQLLVSPFYTFVEKVRNQQGLSHYAPSVSVVIPAWNEEVGIIRTLTSVIQNHYNNFEVIVVNDGSTDLTHKLVTQFIEQNKADKHFKVPIKYIKLANGGKANALNKGLKIATGDILVTIDADSIMDPVAIQNLVVSFTDDKVAAVAGNIVVGNRNKLIEIVQQLEYLHGFFFKRADSVFNSVYLIGGAAAAYRRNVLLELGGFNKEIITEDVEMSTRILSRGYKTRYAAKAVIFTEGPSEWKGLCEQRLRWKFGKLLTFIKHKQLFFSANKSHARYLTFFLLPIAVYSELALLFEGFLLAVFFAYTIFSNDYMPLMIFIGFMSLLISLQVLADTKTKSHLNLLILAPIAWIIFYIVDIVEFQALFRSLKRFVTRETLQWQKWIRVGLISPTEIPSTSAIETE